MTNTASEMEFFKLKIMALHETKYTFYMKIQITTCYKKTFTFDNQL